MSATSEQRSNFETRKRPTPADYWDLVKLGGIAAIPIASAIVMRCLGLIN